MRNHGAHMLTSKRTIDYRRSGTQRPLVRYERHRPPSSPLTAMSRTWRVGKAAPQKMKRR